LVNLLLLFAAQIIPGVACLVLWGRKSAAVEEPEDLLGDCNTLILAYYANILTRSEPKSICVDHRSRVLDLMNLKVPLSKALIGVLEFL
jgi:hypothetical protein